MVRTVTLVVSWFGDSLSVGIEASDGRWVSETLELPITSPKELDNAFSALLQKGNFLAKRAVWLVDHPQLFHTAQELPKADSQTIHQLIERSVKPMGWKAETHAIGYWSCRGASSPKENYVVTVLPKEWRDGIQQATQRQHLVLAGIYSPAAVLHEQYLKGLETNDQGVFLACEVGASLYLVYGASQKGIRLVRSIPQYLKNGPKVSTELERTVLYLRQKLGAEIGALHLAGQQINTLAKELRIPQELQILPSAFTTDSDAYRTLAASIPTKHPANLASHSLLRAYEFQEDWGKILSLTGLGVAALCMLGTLFVGVAGASSWRECQALEKKKIALKNEYEQAKAMGVAAWEDAYASKQYFSLMAALLGRLSETIPSGVRLTGLQAEAKKDHWKVTLKGDQELQLPGNAWPQFKNQISQPPFVAQIEEVFPKQAGNFEFSFNLK